MQATIAHISNGNESKSTHIECHCVHVCLCVCVSFNRTNRTERNENHFKCRKRAYNCRYVWSDLNSILYVSWARFFIESRCNRSSFSLLSLSLSIYRDHALFLSDDHSAICVAFGHHRERGHTYNLFQCSLFSLSHTLNFFVRRTHTYKHTVNQMEKRKQIAKSVDSCASPENVFVYLTMHSNYLRILIFHDDGDSHRRP